MTLLAENLKIAVNREHRICPVKRIHGLSPNPYYKQKEETNRFVAERFPLFSVGFQFRVMRLVFTHRYKFAVQML